MKFSIASAAALAALSLNIGQVEAGPIAMGLCYTACNAGYVTCCTVAGVTAGTFTLGLGIPAAVAACSLYKEHAWRHAPLCLLLQPHNFLQQG
ncbi:hypothetical protein RhiXN_00456 [Rhizoctonia solani]|uniref:Hydrophobin n=1 Tax=Rhizoctonia solani TaxID=456999 RepID=A0A8H8NUU3_9AGAM|nr:uncharacterized protein RhiXN_00456 [Rhizoctonia solani]QRW19050.1 hypothetical protein RhiXN_00456 [Rhizoctonia solani]